MVSWIRSIPSHRHPGDLVRLGLGIFIFITLTLLAFSHTVGPLEEYIFRAINALPSYVTPVVEVVMQLGALFFVPIAAGFALLQRHKRLPLKLLIGGGSAWFLARIAKAYVDRDRPGGLLVDFIERNITSTSFGFPSGHATVAAVLATVVAPYVPKRWRRPVWILAWTVAFGRVFVGVHLPLDVFAGLALGWIIGSAMNLLFGTPDQPLPVQAVRDKLRTAGFGKLRLKQPKLDARGSTPLYAYDDKHEYFVKLIDNEHRNADTLFKLWRYFIMREVEDEAPFARALQLVEHEAYLGAKAREAGVNTPKVVLAAPVTSKAAVLVSEKIDGVELSNYSEKISDSLLHDIWQQIKLLRAANIAHRDLRAANIMIDKTNKPWIIDYSFAETAIDEHIMTVDIVEMLVSLAHIVGAKRAVASATQVLAKETVYGAARYVQPLILSSVTRKSIRKKPELLDAIRDEIIRKTVKRPTPKARIGRFRVRTVIWAAVFLVILAVFIPEIGELDDAFDVLSEVKPVWFMAALGASAMTYIFSAIVLLGASPQPLPYGKVLKLQLATTVANRITPKGLGSIALTERFLEKKGLDRFEGLSAVSLMYFAGVVVHIMLLVIAATILDQPVHLFDVDLSLAQSLLIAFAVSLSLLGILRIPKARYSIKRFLRSVRQNIKRGLEQPVSLLQLIAGSAGITLAYTLALHFSLIAVGVSISFQVVLIVYLAGSAIASAAPTPSGLGAAEAALAAGLTVFDVTLGSAIGGVLLFRLITFWVPILPGLFALRSMRKQQLV